MNPTNIYENFLEGSIDKAKTIQRLFTILENTLEDDIRVNCLKILGKIRVKDRASFKELENLLVSDTSENVRRASCNVIVDNYEMEGLSPILYAYEHYNDAEILENSAYLLANLYLKEQAEGIENLEVRDKDYKMFLKFMSNLEKMYRIKSPQVLILDLLKKISSFEYEEDSIYYHDRTVRSTSNGKFQNLTNLNLNHLELKKIPRALSLLGYTLEKLDIVSNPLSEIKGFENLRNLRELNLIFNKNISEVKGLENLISLKKLNLYFNRITEIKGIGNLKKLEKLDLSCNLIEDVKGLEDLVNLKELLLFFNRLEEINGLETLVKLEKLLLFNNTIREMKGLENLSNLRELNLNSNQIKEIQKLDNLKNLRELHLRENLISEIKNLENLSNLEKLDLRENNITEIKGLDALTNLKELNLHQNKISELKGLEKLQKLKILDLGENNISEIKKLKVLTNLKELNLGGNKIPERDIEELGKLDDRGWIYNPHVAIEVDLKEKFETEVGKHAVWGGKETKSYKEWKRRMREE